MRIKKQYPSQARLKELFDYDEKRGALIWKYRKEMTASWNTKHSGHDAGCNYLSSYHLKYELRVGISKKTYDGIRIIWIWINGDISDGKIISRINHLLPPTPENICSSYCVKGPTHIGINNKEGYLGVHKQKGSSFFRCRIISESTWFATEYAAATHYDNAWEIKSGDRPNGTKKADVSSQIVNSSIAQHIQNATRSLKKYGSVGVEERGQGGKRFNATINRDYLGTYPTKNQAAKAYNDAAIALYGEHAVLNPIGEVF